MKLDTLSKTYTNIAYMLVYGIRCGLPDLVDLPKGTNADYYMDYGLLVFPEYSKATFLRNYTAQLNERFLEKMKRLLETPNRVYEADLEHPYISEEQDAVVKLLQEAHPGSIPTWYHVPKVVGVGST